MLLAYVHGGITGGQVSYSFDSNTPATFASTGGTDFAVGYQVGAGLETKVSENISLGFEYGYTNLGEGDFNTRLTSGLFVVANPDGTDARGSDRSMDFHTIKGTLKFHF
ncbi:MAG: porin family protein [Devosia sp.]|nr:porin family protein [Devosia sp.]